MALALPPCNLFGHKFKNMFTWITDEQSRGVIIVRQGAEAVKNLVEQILGTQLLHDLAIDPRPHFDDPLPVHNFNRL